MVFYVVLLVYMVVAVVNLRTLVFLVYVVDL